MTSQKGYKEVRKTKIYVNSQLLSKKEGLIIQNKMLKQRNTVILLKDTLKSFEEKATKVYE